ncbi:MAG: hypothetical protein ACTS9Y_13440 [Methylophilus sp.]
MQNVASAHLLGSSAKSPNQKEAQKPKQQMPIFAKRLRYDLQRKAMSILWDHSGDTERQHRVCSCHRNLSSDGLPIYRAVDGSNARFANVQTCGSGWVCPVCNPKITEHRREDIYKATVEWNKQGGKCLLMTLTTEHENADNIVEVLEEVSKAQDLFTNDKFVKKTFGTATATVMQREAKGRPVKEQIHGTHQRLGYIRSLEVTHGVNGWHPHFHIVMFMHDDSLLTDGSTLQRLKEIWVKCLIKAGADKFKISDMLKYGLDLRGGDYVADYIMKFGREPIAVNGWTIAHEVTKANSKNQTRNINGDWHYTPFQLLGFATNGEEAAAALFKEFALAFTGKRMNYWTNGLKDYFGINEVDDEEISQEAAEPEVEEELVIYLNPEEWKQVLQSNTRAELLEIAAAFGKDGVIDFLERLPDRPKTHSGHYDVAKPKGIWQ